MPVTEAATYGLLRRCGRDLAVPLAVLQEVASSPVALPPLAASAPDLVGALPLRDLVIPVLDLAPRLGHGAPAAAGALVAVLDDGDGLLGIVVDEVLGLVTLDAGAHRSVRPRAPGECPTSVISHVFRHPEDGRAVAVVDVEAVFEREGVPVLQASASRDTATTTDGQEPGSSTFLDGAPLEQPTGPSTAGDGSRPMTVLRCANTVLALDVAAIHTTAPAAIASPSALDSGACLGVRPFAGREVPVLDPLVLLGLGRLERHEPHVGVVLDLGAGYVALAVSELLEVTSVASQLAAPFPGFTVDRGDLIVGLLEISARPCLLLDSDALRREPLVTSLSRTNVWSDAARASAGTSTDTAPDREDGMDLAPDLERSYLVLQAGVRLATPLDAIAEIIPMPDSLVAPRSASPVLGVLPYRDAAVPLFCLPTLLDRPGSEEFSARCVLLVDVDDTRFGFVVDALEAIEQGRRFAGQEHQTATPAASGRALRELPLLAMGPGQRLVPELDLRGFARRLRDDHAPPEPPVGTSLCAAPASLRAGDIDPSRRAFSAA